VFDELLIFMHMKAIISVFILIVLFSSCATFHPAAPSAVMEKITPPESVVSILNMPVEVDLTPYYSMVEKNVSSVFEGADNPCEGIRYSYQFLRSPFHISGNKDLLRFSFAAKYKIKACYCAKCLSDVCLLPTPNFSCGYSEPMRKVDVGYFSKIKLLPNYRLSSQTKLEKFDPIDKCNISFMNIDVTDKLMKVMREELSKAGKSVDSQLSAYDLKPYLQDIWNKLFEAQAVGNYGYFNINPEAISMSDLSMTGSKLNLKLGLRCRPIFSTSFVPVVAASLPNLSNPTNQSGFKVYTDLVLKYNDLSRLINEKLAGYTYKYKKKKLIVNSIHISGLSNSKLLLKLDFIGYRKGIIYLVGTPIFDVANNTISIPDLNFELKSRNVLLKSASWLLNEKITAKIKSSAVFDLNQMMQQYKGNINEQLNKQLTENVSMKGVIDSINVQSLLTSSESVFLRVYSSGQLSISVY
jgi:hypothetical protein